MTSPDRAYYRFLDTNGDGTGTQNAVGDYSITPEEFYFQPDTDAHIWRMIIHIEDTSGFQAQDYGNITGGLTNGYCLEVKDDNDNVLLDLCDGLKIQTNAEIGRYCYDVDVKTWGAGNEVGQARWTFAKAGYPLVINNGFKLSVTFNDDLSGLIEHYFMLQGYHYQ